MKFKKSIALLVTALTALSAGAIAGCGGESSSKSEKSIPVTTVISDENEEKTPMPESKEYFLEDLLQGSLDVVWIGIPLPPLHPVHKIEGVHYTWASWINVYFESEEQMDTVRNYLSEVKLDRFYMETIEDEILFCGASSNPEINMIITFDNGNKVYIDINNREKEEIGANIFVSYYYFENGNKFSKLFTGLVPDEAKDSLIEMANDIFYEECGKAE